MFELQAEPFRSLEEEIHAVAFLGHNASSLIMQDELLRGLDRQGAKISSQASKLQAVCVSRDLIVLLNPGADQETIALQLAGLKQAMQDSPYDLDPMVHSKTFMRQGKAAGNLEISELFRGPGF